MVENARKYEFFTNKYLKLLEVSCGVSHIAAIAMTKNEGGGESGHIYTWGLPLYGRLGYLNPDDSKTDITVVDEESMEFKKIPVELFTADRVARISCGTDFTACLTVKGQLFTWGLNKWGNLGVEGNTFDSKQNIVNTPTLVKTLINKFVVQVREILLLYVR